jgi:hypothetical protein
MFYSVSMYFIVVGCWIEPVYPHLVPNLITPYVDGLVLHCIQDTQSEWRFHLRLQQLARGVAKWIGCHLGLDESRWDVCDLDFGGLV